MPHQYQHATSIHRFPSSKNLLVRAYLKTVLVCWLQYLVDPGKTLTGAEVNQLHIHGGSALMEASGVLEAEQRKTRGHGRGHDRDHGAVQKWLVQLV